MEPKFARVYQYFPEQSEEIRQLIERDADFREICQDYEDVAMLLESLIAEINEVLSASPEENCTGQE